MGEQLPDSSRLNKSQKLIRILESMQEPGGALVGDLMTRFDLDDRTMRRYLADLRGLELPIHTRGRGLTRRLWLDARYGRRNVRVSLLELVALRFGRTMVAFLQGTGFAEDMDEALDTVERIALDGQQMELAQNLDRKFVAVPEHRKDHTRDAEMIESILSALLYQNPARAHYARLGQRQKRYHLHALTLATFRQGLYLFAFDVDAGKIKTYAVDRFRHFERIRGQHFTYPEGYDPHKLVEDCFGIMGGPIALVELHFGRRAAPYVQERVWHHSQTVESDGGGGLILRMRVGIAPELISWIMGFGPDVRVLGPSELVDRVRMLHRQACGLDEPPRIR